MISQGIFLSKRAKIVVDILLIIGLVLSFLPPSGVRWTSLHCIACIVWYLIMIIHIWQHWKLTKAFTKKKVILKNKVTALIIVLFILMTISILQLASGFEIPHLNFHHLIGRIFVFAIIIHTIQKFKLLLGLFGFRKARQ